MTMTTRMATTRMTRMTTMTRTTRTESPRARARPCASSSSKTRPTSAASSSGRSRRRATPATGPPTERARSTRPRTVAYDAILLDLMLPGVDGWTILSDLRAGGSRHSRPRPHGTGHAARQGARARPRCGRLRHEAVRARGAPGAAPRPDPPVGGEAVARARPRRRPDRHAARHVERDGRPVPLTAKEYAVLEVLAYRRGTPVGRTSSTTTSTTTSRRTYPTSSRSTWPTCAGSSVGT